VICEESVPNNDDGKPADPPTPNLACQYNAFGLHIRSQVPLPELTPASSLDQPDIEILLGSTGRALPTRAQGVVFDLFGKDGHYLAWPDVAAFKISNSDQIIVEPYADVPLAHLPFPLLGPILGLVLHLRGLVVLHASAIEINGRSAIFVGDKMAGKSTTAAAFLREGYRLLTDDLLAIDISASDGPVILPAYGQLKLSDEASQAIALPIATKLPLAYSEFTKRQHRLSNDFSHEPICLDKLYVLKRGSTVPGIIPIKGVNALHVIMRFSYITRFGKIALPGRMEGQHLQRCAQVARSIDVAYLEIPASLERLSETTQLVVDRLGQGR
jgi:hypothetical protein